MKSSSFDARLNPTSLDPNEKSPNSSFRICAMRHLYILCSLFLRSEVLNQSLSESIHSLEANRLLVRWQRPDGCGGPFVSNGRRRYPSSYARFCVIIRIRSVYLHIHTLCISSTLPSLISFHFVCLLHPKFARRTKGD